MDSGWLNFAGHMAKSKRLATGEQVQAKNLNKKNFHLFEKTMKELQRSASCFSISMTEFSLLLKRVMEGDVPASLLEYKR